MKRPTGGKGGAVDPSPLRTRCKECHGALVVVGADSGMHASAAQGSTMGAGSMDSSYVVLSKNNRSQGPGIPPRPRSAAAPHIEPNQPPRPIEGSYIMLPPPAASIYKTSSSEGVGRQLLPPSVNSSSSMPGNNSGFFSSVTVLKRAFEIATSQTQESYSILSEMDFLKEKKKIEEEEKKLRPDIEEAEKQYSEVISEMKDLETKCKHFKELKEQYWQEFNSFCFQRKSHQEEQNAILAKIEVSQAHLELLKHTNVLNDAFYISQHGVFGTINNLRLGHSPEVEWDEINAAWGQVALLLHIMAQYFTPKYQYPWHIMIFSRSLCTQSLFSEVYPNYGSIGLLLWIDGDKIGGYRVVLGDFNTKENSTKALKNMLCDLKWVLYWFIGTASFDLPLDQCRCKLRRDSLKPDN
ncbi:beclin-1-like protein isoform X2 [Sorghum bicolor]|uniref:Atg6 BARA domain-containing protein n=1 Tax=Sorghum bicolor TaxID=4558 RepID=A0A1B6Q5C8_SORBI|nr:beclin-1-like protein isoform X2 [Sorghum bicolor]KXG33124.1 hypothetical protein SORBI_3003G258300 [Sorghum bicolor]|eukprot:XP_021312245.1 beclin-1-like protein isoform X2 [Sorghum bicolor]